MENGMAANLAATINHLTEHLSCFDPRFQSESYGDILGIVNRLTDVLELAVLKQRQAAPDVFVSEAGGQEWREFGYDAVTADEIKQATGFKAWGIPYVQVRELTLDSTLEITAIRPLEPKDSEGYSGEYFLEFERVEDGVDLYKLVDVHEVWGAYRMRDGKERLVPAF